MPMPIAPAATEAQPPRRRRAPLENHTGWALLIWLAGALFHLTAFVGSTGEMGAGLAAVLAAATALAWP
jgi:hypothetical protein